MTVVIDPPDGKVLNKVVVGAMVTVPSDPYPGIDSPGRNVLTNVVVGSTVTVAPLGKDCIVVSVGLTVTVGVLTTEVPPPPYTGGGATYLSAMMTFKSVSIVPSIADLM